MPATVAADMETFTVNGMTVDPPMVDPSALGVGTHTICYTVDAGG